MLTQILDQVNDYVIKYDKLPGLIYVLESDYLKFFKDLEFIMCYKNEVILSLYQIEDIFSKYDLPPVVPVSMSTMGFIKKRDIDNKYLYIVDLESTNH